MTSPARRVPPAGSQGLAVGRGPAGKPGVNMWKWPVGQGRSGQGSGQGQEEGCPNGTLERMCLCH